MSRTVLSPCFSGALSYFGASDLELRFVTAAIEMLHPAAAASGAG
jgi:hypothetical protein